QHVHVNRHTLVTVSAERHGAGDGVGDVRLVQPAGDLQDSLMHLPRLHEKSLSVLECPLETLLEGSPVAHGGKLPRLPSSPSRDSITLGARSPSTTERD